ncbi:MAG: Crp/Fnr family transcriptional regulator [Bdellovibrionaceae bacterium]|nr:Crp/Fnr family transcriptional regulator [Pseudobdellovibrionaceae bacterium]MBX3033139.1 Crp/Fnr family transcriptional regulator [Pseudobdellovibrionaceae bacterium]
MLTIKKRDEDSFTHLLKTHSIVVRRGAFKVTTENGDILALAAGGDLIGPAMHLSRMEVRLRAKALMPEIEVCAMPWNHFEKLMDGRIPLLKLVQVQLATNLMTMSVAAHWAKKSLRERALLVLKVLRDRFSVRYGQFKMIDIPLTKIDIASLMSTVQESAVRVLSEFREDGLIAANGKRIVILDNVRLDRLVQEIHERDRQKAEGEENGLEESPNSPQSHD